MSRHSKWAQIKNQKGAADKKRSKVFSLLSKRISIAARGDKNPETNPGLKMMVEKAKSENMRSDTIERAIKRGAGELPGQGPIEEVVYEAYGPSGVQFIVICATDNRNRTSSNIRHIFSLPGGSISGSGSVMWNFEKKAEGFYAKTMQKIDDATKVKIQKLLDALEDDEDVEKIYTNIEKE